MGKDSGILQSNKNRKKYHNDLINLFLNSQLSILKKKKKSRRNSIILRLYHRLFSV
ncbi:hypothetical protein VCSRO85_2548 [Vibrio cholerae]|nr:hypothetical protein VCSRO85_2548 [Vibrio cholerae]